jgi:MinD superfamily P-loop ATPase
MTDMKEVVIISGKGGTGKTSIAGGISYLMKDKVIVDCDVDAANLYIIITPEEVISQEEVRGGKKAEIIQEECTGCGICRDVCAFDAISPGYMVDKVSCEGCGACYWFCPAHAVAFNERVSGYLYTAKTAKGDTFVFAELLPGEENSGKLVAKAREIARTEAKNNGQKVILIDGPPGVGCPVIASLTGADLAIVVTEPTSSGIHDLKRIVELTKHFQIKTGLILDKSDINPDYLYDLRRYSIEAGLMFIGEIPYDHSITDAQKNGVTVFEFDPYTPSALAMREVYIRLKSILEAL